MMRDALSATVLAQLALLALAFACVRLILRNTLAALLVAAPLSLLIPWRTPLHSVVASAVVLPLGASALLLWWLANERPSSKGLLLSTIPLAVASLIATSLAFLAPQLLFPSLVLSLFYLMRRASPSRSKPLVALVIIPLAYRTGVTFAAAGSLSSALGELASSLSSGWSMRAWFQSSGSYVYRDAVFQLDALFYLPLLLGLVALAPLIRREWWFRPTFLWAAVLACAPILLEDNLHLQYSQPMQLALLLPSGLLGAHLLLRQSTLPMPNSFGGSS